MCRGSSVRRSPQWRQLPPYAPWLACAKPLRYVVALHTATYGRSVAAVLQRQASPRPIDKGGGTAAGKHAGGTPRPPNLLPQPPLTT